MTISFITVPFSMQERDCKFSYFTKGENIMKKLNKTLMGMVAAGAMLAATGAMTTTASAECGDIKMAEFNWASGELMANVDKYILEKRLWLQH